MDEEEQEKIFTEIYCECDNNQSNNVHVSLLLSYIKPFIDSSSHFEDLKKSLDPINNNPLIDKNFFLNAMKNWTEKFKNDVDFNFNNDEISRQSTSTMNLKVDYDPLNLSSISAYSLTGSALSLSTCDVNMIQEQNNELQHQNKKLTENLNNVKSQLTNLEEQNVCLQNDVDRINKNWQSDIKLIKTYQIKCEEYEKEREELTKILDENKKKTEHYLQDKNIKNDLIKKLEKQNGTHIESIEKISTDYMILKKENLERCSEIVRIEECDKELRQKCAQFELKEKSYSSEIGELKNYVGTLEAFLENTKIQAFHNPLKMENFESGISSTSVQNVQLKVSAENVKSQSASPADEVSPSSCKNLQSELLQISTLCCFNTCEHRINKLQEEIGDLNIQLNTKTQELEQTKNQLSHVTTIQENLNQIKDEITSKNRENQQLTDKISEIKNQFNIMKEETQELKQINVKLMNEISSLERGAKLERKRNTRIDLNTKINYLEEQLTYLVSCKNNESSDFAKIRNKIIISDDEKTMTPNCVKLEKLNNLNESFDNKSFLSKLTPKHLKPPPIVVKDKSKNHFIFPPMSPEPEMTPNNFKIIDQPLELNNNEATMSQETESSDNTIFIKTCNDNYIEKILMKQRVDEPLAKIEETFHHLENSGSESVSSKEDDDDEDVEKKMQRRKLRRERKIREDEEILKERLKKQVRSMSEGAAVVHQLSKDGDVMVFPNLQDNSLDALGLGASDQPKERLTDEEIELKFQTLSLAFSIDAVTIKDRLERQQRQRDQSEDNLSAEITRFISAVHKLHPLCVDAETTELVTGLIDRLQIIVQASHRISTSAEIFGSVQQEWRIAESVNLMLSHLRNLIKQRDAARRQLQVTKMMLQETTTNCLKKPVTSGTTRRLTLNTLPTSGNGRVGVTPPRRASIAVIPRPSESPSAMGAPIRRMAVRKPSEGGSESFFKPWDSRRVPLLSRPSRIDINPELSKIVETSADADSIDPAESSDENIDFQTPTILLDNPLIAESQKFMLQQHTTMKKILKYYLGHYGQIALRVFETWAENGTLHEICFIGTIVCFAMATILLCNTIMEIELAREGLHSVPWKWITWDEFWALFF